MQTSHRNYADLWRTRESSLAIIRAGVAQDERMPPFIEYDPQYRPRKFSDPPQVPGTLGPYTSFPAQP